MILGLNPDKRAALSLSHSPQMKNADVDATHLKISATTATLKNITASTTLQKKTLRRE